MSYCGSCHRTPCGCDERDYRRVKPVIWQPNTTVARACYLIHALLKSQSCEANCPDNHLCKLMELECDLCGGRYPLAAIAMMAAARLLESEAITYARKGSVKTLTVTVNGNQSASELREIAKTWREQAANCIPRTKFAAVGTGKSCLSDTRRVYAHCGCYEKLDRCDVAKVTSCNFGCCDDCDD